ncbi:MAG: hypothetical protein C5B50_12710 [Verrucomicrobia bacterium]|nr:MAG: hypothetical protein C5B50_12710 [Verrucomicrobiota bacterium]
MTELPKTMLPRKAIVILLVLLVALAVGIPEQRKVAAARTGLAEVRKKQAALEKRSAEAAAALDSVRQELRVLRTSRDRTLSATRQMEQALAKSEPDSRWAAPPTDGGGWDAESPYVWLRKDFLPQLPVTVFGDDGQLLPQVAEVLCAGPSAYHSLNEKLKHLLAEYKKLEAANVQRIEKPLAGISSDGPQVTVQIKPLVEEGAQLKQQFQAALLQTFGQQRTDLLMQAGNGWFDSRNNDFATEPKTYSVVRHPDGSYNLSIKSGGNWSSVGGIKDISPYIPAHLLPLFSEVVESAAPGDSPTADGGR